MPGPDVQAHTPLRPYPLARVGVRGVRKPVTVHRPGQAPHGVAGDFDLFVDLPAHQRGTHMSRNLEALADILDEEVVGTESPSLENLCRRLALRLLERHDYATTALARVRADYFLARTNPGGRPSMESHLLRAEAEARRGGPVRRSIGVEVVGMTACPCAMETVRARYSLEGRGMPDDLPCITHNQRNRVTLVLEVPEGRDVEAADLVGICEDALSSPTYGLLKRGDEGDLVMQAHAQPRFVEDVVREVLHRVRERFADLGPDTVVFASSNAEESIHKHDAYAERTTTLGELD